MDKFDEVHITLLKTAAEIANNDLRLPLELRGFGHIFREANNQSEKGGLCLELEASLVAYVQSLPEKDEYFDILHTIGKSAIMAGIAENRELFGGMVLGAAKNGNNYFDRFIQKGEQLGLF